MRVLAAALAAPLAATRAHVRKKATRTAREVEQELNDEEAAAAREAEEGYASSGDSDDGDSDEDGGGPIYNPLNLPLGWDGKPIPYWLYKLHGLGVEYPCEICGNFSYWGRRQFDRHFREWRHQYGMRCLGVPNTKHFHDITKIEDARALYAKLKRQLEAEHFQVETGEEFEDTEGNVMDRKTYDDLARQGLL